MLRMGQHLARRSGLEANGLQGTGTFPTHGERTQHSDLASAEIENMTVAPLSKVLKGGFHDHSSQPSIAMLRERTSGTLDRLMTMPISKLDLLAPEMR